MIMSTDATWGNVNYSPIYALALTMYGGVVASHEKLIHLLVDSSQEAEVIGNAKGGELTEIAREILRAQGRLPKRPTPIFTDSKANVFIAAARKSAGRLRHCARRYATLLQRCDRGVVSLHHIAGTENPADVLTKFVDRVKYKKSIEFLTNSKNEVPLSEA